MSHIDEIDRKLLVNEAERVQLLRNKRKYENKEVPNLHSLKKLKSNEIKTSSLYKQPPIALFFKKEKKELFEVVDPKPDNELQNGPIVIMVKDSQFESPEEGKSQESGIMEIVATKFEVEIGPVVSRSEKDSKKRKSFFILFLIKVR